MIAADTSAEILTRIRGVEDRLNAVLGLLATVPPDATAAAQARATGVARGFYFASEFADVIGRHKQWVTDRCAAGVIRTLPGRKPYRISLSQEAVWNRPGEMGD